MASGPNARQRPNSSGRHAKRSRAAAAAAAQLAGRLDRPWPEPADVRALSCGAASSLARREPLAGRLIWRPDLTFSR